MNIIDFHVHPRLDFESEREVRQIIYSAKKCGICRVCLLGDVLGFGYDPSPAQVGKINDQTIKLVKGNPDFFYGCCFLNPKHPGEFIRSEVERCMSNPNFKGIKLEVAVNASDRRVGKVMRLAEKMGLFVVHHSWNTEIIGNRKHQSDPEDIASLAERFPDVRIVMAHITAASERGVLAIQPFPNVWADTSGGQAVAGTVEYALEKLGPERILFGSDVTGRDFSSQLGKIYGADMPVRSRKMILGENARKLLDGQ